MSQLVHLSPINKTWWRFPNWVSTWSCHCQICAQEVNGYSKLVSEGKPNISRLNAREKSHGVDFFTFNIGRPTSSRNHKVIILMGATGCGKSTLINGMINYILWKKFVQKVNANVRLHPPKHFCSVFSISDKTAKRWNMLWQTVLSWRIITFELIKSIPGTIFAR